MTNPLLNPLVAAAIVVVIVNVVSYARDAKPNLLIVEVALASTVGGYSVTGRRMSDELFLIVVYGLLDRSPSWRISTVRFDTCPAVTLIGSQQTS